MNSKSKNTLILFVALLVLVGIYLLWQNPFDNAKNEIQTVDISAGDFAQTQKIEITKGQTNIILEKSATGGKDNSWVVISDDNKPANSALVDDLITSLTENKAATIISRSADKLEKFGLDETTAGKLKLSDGQNNILAELLIGKIGGADYSGTYIQKAGANEILLIDANLLSKIEQPNWLQPDKPADNLLPPANLNQ